VKPYRRIRSPPLGRWSIFALSSLLRAPSVESAALAGWPAHPAARLAKAGIILISLRMRTRSRLALVRPYFIPCSISPVFETAEPAVKRN
jgi:hypothetical protein